MKIIFKTLTFLSFLFVLIGCGGVLRDELPPATPPHVAQLSRPAQTDGAIETFLLLQALDEFAEIERAGAWQQGMALTESGIRENAGDYAGAVVAAYKELAYAYGKGLIQKEEIEQGFLNLLVVNSEETVMAAANVILAFFREQWADAATGLSLLFGESEEPDSFANWMILVCALEKDPEDRRAGAAYRSIRARYAHFPEYWYRGARAFTGAIGADFAENCINSSAQGPFADECRKILAHHTGLNSQDGLSIKTKWEIDTIINQSVNEANPKLLDSLLPLISLPDNTYTIYAVGTLRTLTGVPLYREYFTEQASVSSGRLAERLLYISRG